MFRVKVSGVADISTATHAISSGATAIGASLEPDERGEIPDYSFISQITTHGVDKVAEFESYREGLQLDNFDYIQARGRQVTERGPVWMPVYRPQPFEDLDAWLRSTDGFPAVLIDPFLDAENVADSTNWELAGSFIEKFAGPVVLGGMIGPETVAEAIAVARPYGVDGGPGLRIARGRFDLMRVELFCQSARRALVEVHGPIF